MQSPKQPADLFPTGTPPGADPNAMDELDETAVSPEEQREYNQVVTKAMETIYAAPSEWVGAINSRDQPIHAQVGRAVARLGKMIEGSAEAAGKKLSPDVMFHAAEEITAGLLDLGIEAGVVQIDPESDEYQQVLGMSLMEAAKTFGEDIIADPVRGPALSDEAGNVWAHRVAEEVEAGQADPGFTEMVQTPVSAGVSKAIRG